MNEIIYILINEAMPGYIKIGRTTNLEQRMRSLDTTSVPLPFECFFACTVSDSNFVERQLHDAFADQRVRSSREFFELAPERVLAALKLAAIEDVTPKSDYVETQEDQQALNEARSKRARFNFEMVHIPVGSELTFIKDDTIRVRVVDKSTIEWNGEIFSLSAAAQKALGVDWPAQGPLYWMFEGETLDERRDRMEAGE